MRVLKGHHSQVRDLAFSADGRTLASAAGTGKSVSLWDLAAGKRCGFLSRHQSRVVALAFHPSQPLLASGDHWGYVRLWNVAAREPVPDASARFTGRCLAFDSAGRLILGRAFWTGGCEFRVGEYRRRDWLVASKFLGDIRWHTKLRGPAGCRPECLAVSPDRRWLAAGSAGAIHLWDLAASAPHGTLSLSDAARSLAFSADSRRLLAAAGHDVLAWDVESIPSASEPVLRLRGHRLVVNRVAVSPDGRTVLSAANDGTARLWGLESGREQAAFDWKIGPLSACAFAPDGLRAAAGGTADLVVWDLDDLA